MRDDELELARSTAIAAVDKANYWEAEWAKTTARINEIEVLARSLENKNERLSVENERLSTLLAHSEARLVNARRSGEVRVVCDKPFTRVREVMAGQGMTGDFIDIVVRAAALEFVDLYPELLAVLEKFKLEHPLDYAQEFWTNGQTKG